jgi:hypothetical protein
MAQLTDLEVFSIAPSFPVVQFGCPLPTIRALTLPAGPSKFYLTANSTVYSVAFPSMEKSTTLTQQALPSVTPPPLPLTPSVPRRLRCGVQPLRSLRILHVCYPKSNEAVSKLTHSFGATRPSRKSPSARSQRRPAETSQSHHFQVEAPLGLPSATPW